MRATSSPAPPASSARISPRRSPGDGHEVVGHRLLHRLLRRRAEGGERARAARCSGSTSPRDALDLAGVRRRLPPRRPAGCAQLRRRVRALPASATCSPRSACSRRPPRDGVRVVFASSSSVYGEAERYPTPEDSRPRPVSPYGITKLACEHLARAYARELRPRRRRAALLQRLRPAAAARHGVHAHRDVLAEGRAVRALRRRARSPAASPTSPTSSTRRSRRWSGGSGHVQRRRRRRGDDARDDRAARARSRAARSSVRGRPAVPGDQRRTKADTTRIREPSSAGSRRRRSSEGLAGPVGVGRC